MLWLSDTAVMWLMLPNHLSNFLQVPACASHPTPRIPGLVPLPQQCTGLIFSFLEKFYSFDSVFQLHLWGYFYPLDFFIFVSCYGQDILLCLKRQGRNHTKGKNAICSFFLANQAAIGKHSTSSPAEVSYVLKSSPGLSVNRCKSQCKHCTMFSLSSQPRIPIRCEFLMQQMRFIPGIQHPCDWSCITASLVLWLYFLLSVCFACWSSPLLMGGGSGRFCYCCLVFF